MVDLTMTKPLEAGQALQPPDQLRLHDDILRGADEIALFVFGPGKNLRRKVYYLVETKRLPVFRLGAERLYARRSTLLGWIKSQEQGVYL
jgi:hypothetical protein